jgi:hypothetical protein
VTEPHGDGVQRPRLLPAVSNRHFGPAREAQLSMRSRRDPDADNGSDKRGVGNPE